MSDPFKDFKFEWRTDAQNNEAIWFLNPWTNGWEELAMIKWCCHPPEKLQEVDAFFESLQSSWVNALQLTESNRQLREELEIANGICNTFWDALKLLKLNAIDVHNPGRHFTQRIATLTTALAAAKEALACCPPHREEWMSDAGFNDFKTKYDKALARIAECEKGT